MKEKLNSLPNNPGSYLFLNKNNIIIYVGKAKNLKNRVNSYFKGTLTGKTKIMIEEVVDLKYITTKTEVEAFILEQNLIKKHNPKYNVLLKDDKSYPYIEYSNNKYPTIKVVRYNKKTFNKNKHLFGPFPSAYSANRIVRLINRLYPLKKCRGLPKEVCLYYHINECLGYCAKEVDQVIVKKMEEDILSFFKGNSKILITKVNNKIAEHNKNLNFEVSNELKEDLKHINVILDKQYVEFNDLINRDIIGFIIKEEYIGIQILFVRQGKVLGSNFNVISLITDKKDDITRYLLNFYENHEIPKEILITEDINNNIISTILNIKVYTPQIGKKQKLISIAMDNALFNLDYELNFLIKKDRLQIKQNNELEKLLNLEINRIDIFDNSNLSDEYKVSSMVVFKNGKPEKKEYRKFKIASDKKDDYNMMREVIYRRYSSALIEDLELPDLIIVDGGKSQIGAAKSILEDLNLEIKIVGLIKDNNHKTKELVLENNNIVEIKSNKELFNYLTKIQDEVHRFTINYHRTLRSKDLSSSILDEISGIGNKRKIQLLKKYTNINNIKKASIEELSEILPKNTVINLKKYFEDNEV